MHKSRPDPGSTLSVVRTGTLAQTQTYEYDDMDRLKSVCFQAGTCPGGSDSFIRWTYDGVGNRLTEARPTGTTSYTYNVADEPTQAGSTGSVHSGRFRLVDARFWRLGSEDPKRQAHA